MKRLMGVIVILAVLVVGSSVVLAGPNPHPGGEEVLVIDLDQ